MEKKISFYWVLIGFLALGLILALTWRGGDQQVLVNQITLAVGIASIFLAVVAMFYAFIQSEQSARQSGTVQSALNSIVEKVENYGY